MDWNDTKTIMLEVEQLFNRGDDLRYILDIKKMQQELDTHHANSLKDAKELIKELTNIIALKEKEVMAPPESLHNNQMEKISTEKENISNQLQHIQDEIDKKQQNTLKSASDCLKLRRKVVELSEENTASETRTYYALSLYNKICGVAWDYNTNPDTLSGTISNESKQEIRNFELKTSALSDFTIANQLWNLVEQGYPNL